MIFTMRKTRGTRKKLNALVRDENFIAKKRARVKGENPNILALSICEGEIPLFLFYAFVPKRTVLKRSEVFSSPKSFKNTLVDGPPFLRRPST